MPYTAVFPGLALVVGLILGSFYNVCIHRTLTGESVYNPPRSKCPHCGHFLSWWENIPLLSYALLLGRCRSCREKISWRYPLVEFLGAASAFGLGLSYGPDPAWAVAMVFTGLAIVLGFIALARQPMPKRPLWIALPGALVLGPLVMGLPLTSSLAGAGLGVGILGIVKLLVLRLNSAKNFGIGEILLAGMSGALCGIEGLPIGLVSALLIQLCAAGFMFLQKKKEPNKLKMLLELTGPALCSGLILALIFGPMAASVNVLTSMQIPIFH